MFFLSCYYDDMYCGFLLSIGHIDMFVGLKLADTDHLSFSKKSTTEGLIRQIFDIASERFHQCRRHGSRLKSLDDI